MGLPALATWDPEDCPRLPGHDTVNAVRNRLLRGWTPFTDEHKKDHAATHDDGVRRPPRHG